MKLPGGDEAIVDIRKLHDYCLNPDHPEGKHKARVFASALSLSQADAEELQVALYAAARNDEATESGETPYGKRYTLDFLLTRQSRTAKIRSGWLIRNDEDFPRLTSCYVDD